MIDGFLFNGSRFLSHFENFIEARFRLTTPTRKQKNRPRINVTTVTLSAEMIKVKGRGRFLI